MPGGAVVNTVSVQTSEPAATSASVVPLPVASTISGSSSSLVSPATSTALKDQSPEQRGPSVTWSVLFGTPGLPLIRVRISAFVGEPVHSEACEGVGVAGIVSGPSVVITAVG